MARRRPQDLAHAVPDRARRRRGRACALVFLPAITARFGGEHVASNGGTLDVCGMVPAPAVAEVLGVDAVEARHIGAGPEVPAEGTCTWNFRVAGKEARVVALVFTRASLKRGGIDTLGKAYFQTVATGLEYTYKETPLTLHGLGDEAAAAGFGARAMRLPNSCSGAATPC
jgi:hypothetical protein